MPETPVTRKLAHPEQFNDTPDVYDVDGARPAYLQTQIDKVLTAAGITLDDEIAELGAGTGKMSRRFEDRCKKLHCIELNPKTQEKAKQNMASMRAKNQVNFILAGSPKEPFKIALPDKSVKLVTMGDAAHWFDNGPEVTAEIARVLAPGGKVAVIVRYPDPASPIVQELHRLLEVNSFSYKEEGANKLLDTDDGLFNQKIGKHLIAADSMEIPEPMPQQRTPEQLLRYLQSRSSTTAWANPPKQKGEDDEDYKKRLVAAEANAYETVINPLFEKFGRDGIMDLPYVFHANIGEVRHYEKTVLADVDLEKGDRPK